MKGPELSMMQDNRMSTAETETEQGEIRNNCKEIKCPTAKWMSKWNNQHSRKIESIVRKTQQTL